MGVQRPTWSQSCATAGLEQPHARTTTLLRPVISCCKAFAAGVLPPINPYMDGEGVLGRQGPGLSGASRFFVVLTGSLHPVIPEASHESPDVLHSWMLGGFGKWTEGRGGMGVGKIACGILAGLAESTQHPSWVMHTSNFCSVHCRDLPS